LRTDRLLTTGSQRGSSPVEVVFAMAVLLLLTLGVMEVALALYGRNVVLSSAHEGARAAVELGTSSSDAARIANETVRRSAGGLISQTSVEVALDEVAGRVHARVNVSGVLTAFGPIPLRVPVSAAAHASRPAATP
jgi:Flp pilus assembly protein TadG